MKIVKIKSGLGNQMFQYAFAKACQKRSGETVLLDLSNYKTEHLHNGYELSRLFNIDLPVASRSECDKIATIPDNFLRRIRRKFFTKKTHLIENENIFDKRFFNCDGNFYFEGYWQNEDYFSPLLIEEIRSIFAFKPQLDEKNIQLMQKLDANSASIHVRRGDYLLKENQNLNLCTIEYYKKALKSLFEQKNISNLLFFSDDIAWCKENFTSLPVPVTFVDWNTGENSWQDMALMAKCGSNIIANSSFSWWGAYLNPNPEKIVIAPAFWNSKNIQTEKKLPENWQALKI